MSAFPGPEPGFVEPTPEFYGRFADLVKKSRRKLDTCGALAKTTPTIDVTSALAIVAKVSKDKRGIGALSENDIELLAQLDVRVADCFDLPAKEKKEVLEGAFHVVKTLSDLIGKERLNKGLSAKENSLFAGLLGQDQNLGHAWDDLLEHCRQLEILAHKQLRAVPLNKKEKEFIRGYGKSLAAIMLYGGNSYITPRDDAPRIVDVFSNPAKGKHLLVGIGKPRDFWLLYPRKGREILCRGGVIPYYEFAHPNRLTDRAWRTLLKSKDAPQPPDWVWPIAVRGQ